MNFKEISGKELENIKGNVKIVDVREEDEYNLGHVKNAINLPLSKIMIGDIGSIKKDEKLILYCRSNHRSKKAIEILAKLGFKDLTLAPGVALYNYNLIK